VYTLNIMKSKIIFILALVFCGFSIQDLNFTLIKSIPSSSSSITSDFLGNLYITKGNSLEKYDSEGELFKNLSNKNIGNLSFVDAHDPLKILLYYNSFQQIKYVDNMLAGSGNSISLDALGYSQTSLVCSSHNNGFWIYNPPTANLIRFDRNLKTSHQTGNINQLTGLVISPNFMTEQNNHLFVNNPLSGILVFDIYGTYSRTIPLKGLKEFQVSENEIFYFQDDKLKSYNLKTLEENEIVLPTSNVLMARTEKEKLYLLKEKSIDIYSSSK